MSPRPQFDVCKGSPSTGRFGIWLLSVNSPRLYVLSRWRLVLDYDHGRQRRISKTETVKGRDTLAFPFLILWSKCARVIGDDFEYVLDHERNQCKPKFHNSEHIVNHVSAESLRCYCQAREREREKEKGRWWCQVVSIGKWSLPPCNSNELYFLCKYGYSVILLSWIYHGLTFLC